MTAAVAGPIQTSAARNQKKRLTKSKICTGGRVSRNCKQFYSFSSSVSFITQEADEVEDLHGGERERVCEGARASIVSSSSTRSRKKWLGEPKARRC